MVWFLTPLGENVKLGSVKYLLQKYLGRFLQEKLTLDQLTVDVFKGTGTLSDVILDVKVSFISFISVLFVCFACFSSPFSLNNGLLTGGYDPWPQWHGVSFVDKGNIKNQLIFVVRVFC